MQVILRLDPGGLEEKVTDEVLRDSLAQLAIHFDLELVIVDHRMRPDLLPTPPVEVDMSAEVALVAKATSDPGRFTERDMTWAPPRWKGDLPQIEPLHVWQARAVLAALYGGTGVPA